MCVYEHHKFYNAINNTTKELKINLLCYNIDQKFEKLIKEKNRGHYKFLISY